MKKKISKVWIAVAVILILAIVVFVLTHGKKEAQITFKTEKVQEQNIQNSVTATGTIEPVTSVSVGTQVSGIVSHLYVDYNSTVHKGQVIAELDKTNLLSQLNSAKAGLQSARASVTRAQAEWQSVQANVNYQKANYNRYQTLYHKGLVSASDYENARLGYQQAVESSASYQQQVATARQQVAQAEEQVAQAQTNLGYATITSPIDGVVLSKEVEEGQTVAASFSTPELFKIAKDLTNMQVVANVDEADIGEVKRGERVSFTVDAYPDDTFQGTVTQVRQEATTTNNVVTYEVVISAPNRDLKLKPGLTANVTIYTAERSGVLSVPSKALRFVPTQEALGKKYRIQDIAKTKNKVWTLEGNTLKAHSVNIGINDGSHTQIISGIKAGTTVITSIEEVKDDEEEQQARSPFAPNPKKEKKQNK